MIHCLLADRTDETLIVLNAEYAFACIINISRDVLREYMYMVLPVSLISLFYKLSYTQQTCVCLCLVLYVVYFEVDTHCFGNTYARLKNI